MSQPTGRDVVLCGYAAFYGARADDSTPLPPVTQIVSRDAAQRGKGTLDAVLADLVKAYKQQP